PEQRIVHHLDEVVPAHPGRRRDEVGVLEAHHDAADDGPPGEDAEDHEHRGQEEQGGEAAAAQPGERRPPAAGVWSIDRSHAGAFCAVSCCAGCRRDAWCAHPAGVVVRCPAGAGYLSASTSFWMSLSTLPRSWSMFAFLSVSTACTTESRAPYSSWVCLFGS